MSCTVVYCIIMISLPPTIEIRRLSKHAKEHRLFALTTCTQTRSTRWPGCCSTYYMF